jgi:hypothetical protein
MAAVQPGGTLGVARASWNRVPMDQATRRAAAFQAQRLAPHGMAARCFQIVRGLHGEYGFRRWHPRTDASRRGLADCVHVFGRPVVAMPSANHLGQSRDSRLDSRAHHANREIVDARARAVRARRGRTNHLRRCGYDRIVTELTVPMRRRDGLAPGAGSLRCRTLSRRRLLRACLSRRPGRRDRRPRARDRSGSRRS